MSRAATGTSVWLVHIILYMHGYTSPALKILTSKPTASQWLDPGFLESFKIFVCSMWEIKSLCMHHIPYLCLRYLSDYDIRMYWILS